MLTSLLDHIRKARPRRIAIMSGAGISAESGIPTFRGSDGLWENHRAEELATPQGFARDPLLVWRWYEWRRDIIRKAEPNAAHHALASLQRSTRVESTLITQNVDGLHARSGSTSVLELHGNIFRARCMREGTTRDFPDPCSELPPLCECGAMLRPDVIWFGEPLDPSIIDSAVEAVSNADLLLIIGTSGVVYPAAGLVGYLRHGKSVEINPEATPLTSGCDFPIRGTAAEVVPSVVEALGE